VPYSAFTQVIVLTMSWFALGFENAISDYLTTLLLREELFFNGLNNEATLWLYHNIYFHRVFNAVEFNTVLKFRNNVDNTLTWNGLRRIQDEVMYANGQPERLPGEGWRFEGHSLCNSNPTVKEKDIIIQRKDYTNTCLLSPTICSWV